MAHIFQHMRMWRLLQQLKNGPPINGRAGQID